MLQNYCTIAWMGLRENTGSDTIRPVKKSHNWRMNYEPAETLFRGSENSGGSWCRRPGHHVHAHSSRLTVKNVQTLSKNPFH
jgi:hypothetical protein